MHKNKSPHDTKPAQAVSNAQQVWYGLGPIILTLVALSTHPRAEDVALAQSRPVTLVELYTSQGCSSCPPADQFLLDLVEQPDVLPLSFHVDYWDSEHWRDPFSRKAFSFRQMAYQESLNTDYVYTPQMVISGKYAVPGGQRAAVLSAIKKSPAEANHTLMPLLKSIAPSRVEVHVPAVTKFTRGTVYLVVYNSHQTTRIQGGENRGRTLRNANVVTRLISLASYEGTAQSFSFARDDLDASSSDGIAVFIQSDDGTILAAAALPGKARPSSQAKLVQSTSSTLR